MNEIQETVTGTLIVNGVEYNQYPPPGKLVKVMKKCRACELICNGKMRFGSLAEYRKWENEALGDSNDGKGMYVMNGHEYNTGSINEVFAWCSSIPAISIKRILEFAKSSDYDCIVEITNPIELIRRISNCCKLNGGFLFHCGGISYDRGSEINKETLNNQQFHFNVFQKSLKFKDDQEYRLSITNCST